MRPAVRTFGAALVTWQNWLPMDVDIWSWVGGTQRQLHEAGNVGLAMALGDVPAQALEGRYGQLDVVAPAIAQQAETMEQPWLELFARYWHLIGRVGDRANGSVAVDDARELVSFAARGAMWPTARRPPVPWRCWPSRRPTPTGRATPTSGSVRSAARCRPWGPTRSPSRD